MRNHLFAAATAFLLLPATAATQWQIPAPVRAAADVIQQSSLKRDVDYLASDALRGRETPSPGLDSAAAYVARPHNVVARIEGSDPRLRHEAVVIMAHLDGAAAAASGNARAR